MSGLATVLLVGVVLLVFWPVCGHEFVAWDDTHNFAANPRLNPPTIENLGWFWGHAYKDLYVPVTYTVWSGVAMVARMPVEIGSRYELNSYVFHSVNLLLHMASAVIVLVILRGLTRSEWAAWCGAMVFAVHPVQVESVAWASGTKDVLAGLLGLCAIGQYLKYARLPSGAERWRAIGLASAAFVLAMLAKPSAVVVPVVAGILDWGVLRRPVSRTWLPLGSWLVMCIPVIVVARIVQPAESLGWQPALWQRPMVAADALAFYVRQLMAPVWVCIDYGRSPAWLWSSWQVYLTWIVPVALGAMVMKLGRGLLAAGVCVFVATLLPVLGLVSFDFQAYSTTADHYLYLAMLGPAIVVAGIVDRFAGRMLATAVMAIVVAGAWSFVLCWNWRDSETLFTHTLAVNPRRLAGNVNLGKVRVQQANTAAGQANRAEAERLSSEAIALYRRALEVAPSDWQVHNNLALAYKLRRQWAKAAEHFRAAVRLLPGSAELHTSLGSMLGNHGDLDGAIAEFHEALRIEPAYGPAQANLATALAIKQRAGAGGGK